MNLPSELLKIGMNEESAVAFDAASNRLREMFSRLEYLLIKLKFRTKVTVWNVDTALTWDGSYVRVQQVAPDGSLSVEKLVASASPSGAAQGAALLPALFVRIGEVVATTLDIEKTFAVVDTTEESR